MINRISTRVIKWSMEHKTAYRVIFSAVYALSLGVQLPNVDEGGWLSVFAVGVSVILVAGWIAIAFQWRRVDLLDELKTQVTDQTDDTIYGDIAWIWAYNVVPTRHLREVVGWMDTHHIAYTDMADMPQPVKMLAQVLHAEAL